MKNIILNLTPAMQATTGGIDPQRQIALEVCMAIKNRAKREADVGPSSRMLLRL